MIIYLLKGSLHKAVVKVEQIQTSFTYPKTAAILAQTLRHDVYCLACWWCSWGIGPIIKALLHGTVEWLHTFFR